MPHFGGHPLASQPIIMSDNARPHRACIEQGYLQQEAIELLPFASHVTGYESDRIFMGLSRTKSESTYPKVSKRSRIRDCFGSGMATVPLTQTETLDSRNEEMCWGTVQDARRLYSLLTVS